MLCRNMGTGTGTRIRTGTGTGTKLKTAILRSVLVIPKFSTELNSGISGVSVKL